MLNFQAWFSYAKITLLIYHLGLIISCFGILGNILTFLVFLRKRFQNSSFSFYFKILAIINTILLLHAFVRWSEFVLKFDLFNGNMLGCHIIYYLCIALMSISEWLVPVISFDRLTKIILRLRQIRFLKKRSFKISLIVLIFIFSFSHPIFVPINAALNVLANSNNNRTNLTYESCNFESIVTISKWISLANKLFTFVLMVIITIISIYVLAKSRNKLATSCPILRRNRRNRDRKYAINSIVLNIVRFICKIPAFILFSVLMKVSDDRNVFEFIRAIVRVCFMIDNSSLFFVNMIVNSIFREQFVLMITFKNKQTVQKLNIV